MEVSLGTLYSTEDKVTTQALLFKKKYWATGLFISLAG